MFDSIATGLASGLLVVFLAWLAKSLFLARRLFLIQPKLFDYTELGNAKDSKTIELTIFNGGTRVEEEIKLQLSPAFQYTILASNMAGLAVTAQGVMQLERLAPKQEMTVVLIAEGGEFRKEHVVGISSKDSVGKIKDSLQDAQLTPIQNVGIGLLLLVLLPASGYFVGRHVIEDAWRGMAAKSLQVEKQLKFDLGSIRVGNISASKRTIQAFQEAFVVEKVERTSDLVKVHVKLTNSSKKRIAYTLTTTSPVSENRPLGVHYFVADILVFPSGEKRIVMTDYLPVGVEPQLIGLEVRVDSEDERAYFSQDVLLNKVD